MIASRKYPKRAAQILASTSEQALDHHEEEWDKDPRFLQIWAYYDKDRVSYVWDSNIVHALSHAHHDHATDASMPFHQWHHTNTWLMESIWNNFKSCQNLYTYLMQTRHMLCLNLTCKVLHLMTSTTLQDLSFGKRLRVFIKSHYQKFQKIRRWLMLRFLSNFMEYRVSSKSCASVMSILCHQKVQHCQEWSLTLK